MPFRTPLLSDNKNPNFSSESVFARDKEAVTFIKTNLRQHVEMRRYFILGADQHVPGRGQLLFNIETPIIILVHGIDERLQLCWHVEVRKTAPELLLNVLVHTADPETQVRFPSRPLEAKTVSYSRRDRQGRNFTVKNIEIGTGIVCVDQCEPVFIAASQRDASPHVVPLKSRIKSISLRSPLWLS